MKRALLILPYLLFLTACMHAQTGHLGGTGGSGGTAGWQNGNRPALFISTPSLPDATATVAYTTTLSATNAVGSLTWTIMLGSLPAGLTLNSSSGVISGTPTTPGINTFTVLVTDSASPTAQTATKQFTLNVNCAPLQQTSTSPLPDAGSGIAYSFQFLSQGGQGTVTWAQTGAPTGITLSSSGLLSGTSTAVGTVTMTVTATDSCPVPQVVPAQYTLTVSPGVTIVTTSPLANATTGAPYQVTLAAQGGTAPYTWAVTSGTLPAGLVLSPAGVISGTPTGVGTSTFTITVTDSAAGTTNAPFTITVACVPLSIVSGTTLPQAAQGQSYNFQFTASGGNGTDTWSLINGTTLPNGLGLSSGGFLTGVPVTAGSYTFDIAVTDSCPVPQTTSNTFSLTVSTSITITTSSPLPNAVVGQAYSAGMAATGGTPPYSWSAPGGPIAPGAEDILDYAMMPISGSVNRYNSHLAATGLYKSYRLNAGLLWWLKNLQGFPWDGEIVGDDYVGQWFTEMDPSQNANCVAAGFTNCFNDPQAYKKYRTPVKLWKRYHVPGADDVVYTPGPNVYDLTVNCGADNQTAIDNLGVRGELTGPFTDVLWQTTFGGSIPDHTPYLLAQKWIKCTSNNVGAACPTEEDYLLVKGYGQVRWCPKSWNGTTYVTGTCTTQANVVAGGAPTPNFACRIPNYPFPNSLPPGVTSTSSTQMTINDQTGAITGTPTQIGTFGFTVQVEDALGAITQKTMTLTVTCAPMAITSPATLPLATQNIAYNFQFSATGGATPITWSQIQGTIPAGLTLSSAGVLSGTPTATGVFHFVIQALDSCAPQRQSQQIAFTLTVQANSGPLTITTSSPLPQGNQGSPYSATVAATGGTSPYTWAVSAGSLPAGLSLNTSTGVISGTPTASGVSAFTLRVTDSLAGTTTKAFTITISCPALSIATTSPIPPATQGQPYSFQFASTGGDPRTVTLNWTASPTPGVTGYNIYRGTTSGTYTRIATGIACCTYLDTTVVNGGIYFYAITAVSTAGESAFSNEVTANANLIWSGTGIPAGLTLDATGLLHGTPTGTGTTSMSITVTDTCSPTPQSAGPTSFSITINAAPPPVSITTSSPLAPATQGVSYTGQMAATGGTGPYTWTITSGSMPAGLTLASSGLISGTPTTIGTSTPTIRVTDSLGATASGSFSITVSCTALAISTTALPTGTQNSPYSFQMTSTGGTGAKTWSLFGGAFPTGVTISGGGLISGTPTASGSFSPQIRVTDACSTPQTATTTFPLTINPATVPLQITTSSPLQTATANQAYSVTLAATGGTPPYGSWTVTVGTLPTGLTLHSATGVIDGTPTVAGTSSFTVRVTDGAAANATKAFSLTVNAVSTGDNRYCTLSGTWIGPTTDGVATLPNRCINTSLAATPASGPTKTVCASGCDFTTISAALTASSCGWVIQVKALNGTAQASYAGFTLPAKSCTASNWIIIETDQIAASGMAPEGTRITPAWIGIASMTGYPQYGQPTTGAGIFLPKITGGSNNVINRTSGANFYRLIGLEVTSTSGVNITDLTLTSNTDHIIWDRMLVHGGASATGHATTNNTRGFDWAQSTNQAIIDSYIYDFHTSGAGSSCILIGGTSSVPEGPHKIVNNFCSAADSFSGLGGGGAGTASTIPSDIEVRRNHFFKPLFWKRNDPSYFGTSFTVKDHIDWKNAQRVLVEGNIMDNTWGQQSDQPGPAVEFGAKNQSSFNSGTASSDGAGTLTATTGTFNSNIVSSSCASPGHCRVNYNGAYFAQTWIDSTHITVRSSTGTVPPVSSGTPYTAYAPGLNPNATVADITMRYNLIRHASRGIEVFQATSDGGDFAKFTGRIEIHDNVADDLDGFHWNLSGGACCAWALGLYISNSNPTPSNLSQIDIHHNTLLPLLTGGGVGDGPSFGFSGQSNTNGTIRQLKLYDNISASGWGLATLGVCTTPKTALKDIQCMDSLNGAPQNTYCFDRNVLATTTSTSGTVTGTANIPPYPGVADSPGCSFTRAGNPLPASYNAIQFTNLNGANGGNYQLLNTSPYHNTASDGTDPGVNWPLLQLNIAGAQ